MFQEHAFRLYEDHICQGLLRRGSLGEWMAEFLSMWICGWADR